MGRGSSKAGGGGGGMTPTTPNQVTPPTPADVAKGNILPKGGVPYDDFVNMTDDEKADVVDKALQTGVPMFLEDSALQKFAYFTGMSSKPTVVSDSALDSMQGEEMFRTVNNAYNASTDIGYTSKDIATQITTGDFTMYSDSGGSAHGKAIYFATSYQDSSYYGNPRQNALTMRAKVTGKTISENSLDNLYNNALSRGDKLAKACSKSKGNSMDGRNLYALTKGYDVITASYGSYRMVVNRKGITCSSTFKTTKVGGNSW